MVRLNKKENSKIIRRNIQFVLPLSYFVFFDIKCFYRKPFKVQLQTASTEITIQLDLVEFINSTCVNWFLTSIIQWVYLKPSFYGHSLELRSPFFTAKVTPHNQS